MRKHVVGYVLVLFMSAGCVEPVDSAGTSRAALVPAPGDAWAELEVIYAEEIDRQLDALSVAERSRAESSFLANSEDPRTLRVRLTSAGTPRSIVAPGFRLSASRLGLSAGHPSPRSVANAFVARYAGL